MRTAQLLTLSLLATSPFVRSQTAVAPNIERPDTSVRRFEIGGQVTDIRTDCIGQKYCNLPSFGIGVGATTNLNQHFALDTNFNITPGSSNEETNIAGGRASEFLAGIRAEVRDRRYGAFLKAQPGFHRWSNVITGVVYPTPATFSFLFGSKTTFVSNVGAGFEYSPSARIHVRTEVSDLVMRDPSHNWHNNLQSTVGVYVSMGNPIKWTPPVYDAKAVHPFFGQSNLVLITGSVLGVTADSITTQRFIKRGIAEGDPFARPLVKYGWSGQITLDALDIGAQILGMYGLHRIGQHWVERLLPACSATTSGIFAYNNTKLSYSKLRAPSP